MTINIVNQVEEFVSDTFLNNNLIPNIIKLASDAVPNIRFNVAKTLEKLASKLDASTKVAGHDAMVKLVTDPDVDV